MKRILLIAILTLSSSITFAGEVVSNDHEKAFSVPASAIQLTKAESEATRGKAYIQYLSARNELSVCTKTKEKVKCKPVQKKVRSAWNRYELADLQNQISQTDKSKQALVASY
ncbi:MAG: hypothetical protein AB8B97_05675 [Granulosicoccus sp.]